MSLVIEAIGRAILAFFSNRTSELFWSRTKATFERRDNESGVARRPAASPKVRGSTTAAAPAAAPARRTT